LYKKYIDNFCSDESKSCDAFFVRAVWRFHLGDPRSTLLPMSTQFWGAGLVSSRVSRASFELGTAALISTTEPIFYLRVSLSWSTGWILSHTRWQSTTPSAPATAMEHVFLSRLTHRCCCSVERRGEATSDCGQGTCGC
jgi:hypothetical protein